MIGAEFVSMIRGYRMACLATGLSHRVLAAIWAHETDFGKSEVWKNAKNPGGLQWVDGYFITEACGTYRRKTGRVVYAKYPNQWVAIAAHVLFLHGPRYQPAHETADEQEQVRRLAKAGYIGGGPAAVKNWITRVLHLLQEVTAWEDAGNR